MAVVLAIAMVSATIMGCTKSTPVSEKTNTEKTTSKETKDKSAQKQSKKADQQVTAKETKKEDKDVTEKTNDSKTASADTKQTSKKTAEDKKTDASESKSDKKSASESKPAAGNSSKPAESKPTENNTSKPASTNSSKPNASKPAESKPATGNTSSAGNKPESGSSSNTPAHQHNFQPVPKVVHHEATGHNEQYVEQEAWDETVIIGTEIIGDWACCNVCRKNITGIINQHQKEHALAGEGGGWHTEYYERDITDVIHHEAVYGTRWVEDSKAWDETVIDGYKCSCGATK